MTSKAKIWILSSVSPWLFAQSIGKWIFTPQEEESALKNEIDIWRQTIEVEYLRENTKFEVINVIEWLPEKWKYDGYILWWSPSMVTQETLWMKEFQQFIHKEIEQGKHVLWFCFGHQILAKAFWGNVEYAAQRKIWQGTVFLNTHGKADIIFSKMWEVFQSLWSHQQYVSHPGEAQVLWYNEHTPNQIIKVWENAWGCQFHSEFTPEFCSFLAKLMKESLSSTWIHVEKVLEELSTMKSQNPSSKLVTLFLENLHKNWK